MKKKILLQLLLFCALVFLLCILGPVDIGVTNIFKVLVGKMTKTELAMQLFWQLRFPKLITSVMAGAALSVSGLILQTYFRNPLAGPFVLGISSGASLGVAFFVMLSASVTLNPLFSQVGVNFAAILGSLMILLILLVLFSRIPQRSVILIMGLMFSYFTSALINIMVVVSDAQNIKTYLLWTLGSFTRLSGDQLLIFSGIIGVALFLSLFLIRPLNLLLFGDHYAQSMGLSLRRVRFLIILLVALLSGTVTAFCGPVAFLGIIVPHIARSLFRTNDHRILLPLAILMGANVAMGAQVLMTYYHQYPLPLNAVLGILAVPVIALFLWKNKQEAMA